MQGKRSIHGFAVLFLASIALAACQPEGSPSAPAAASLSPEVRDPDRLTRGLEVVAPNHLALSAGLLVPAQDPNEAVLEWSGLACELFPTITVSGALPDRVTIRVDRGPISTPSCLDTSAGRAIKFTFVAAIDTSATDVDVFPGRPNSLNSAP